jgi:hypothetical protein
MAVKFQIVGHYNNHGGGADFVTVPGGCGLNNFVKLIC